MFTAYAVFKSLCNKLLSDLFSPLTYMTFFRLVLWLQGNANLGWLFWVRKELKNFCCTVSVFQH